MNNEPNTTTHTFSIHKANIVAIIAILPIGIILGVPFLIIHGFNLPSIDSVIEVFGGMLILLFIFLVGIVVHEILHALGWVFFTQRKWESIKFGIKWEFLTPYCHCKEPLKKWQFLIGAALPLIVLGLIPVIVSYFNGSIGWWFFGFFFTVSAIGDIIAIWMLRKVSHNASVQDHPEELGFIVGEGTQEV